MYETSGVRSVSLSSLIKDALAEVWPSHASVPMLYERIGEKIGLVFEEGEFGPIPNIPPGLHPKIVDEVNLLIQEKEVELWFTIPGSVGLRLTKEQTPHK